MGDRTCSGTPGASCKIYSKTFTCQATALSTPTHATWARAHKPMASHRQPGLLVKSLQENFWYLGILERLRGGGRGWLGCCQGLAARANPFKAMESSIATTQYSLRTCLRKLAKCFQFVCLRSSFVGRDGLRHRRNQVREREREIAQRFHYRTPAHTVLPVTTSTNAREYDIFLSEFSTVQRHIQMHRFRKMQCDA